MRPVGVEGEVGVAVERAARPVIVRRSFMMIIEEGLLASEMSRPSSRLIYGINGMIASLYTQHCLGRRRRHILLLPNLVAAILNN